jgi:hypothetical protein
VAFGLRWISLIERSRSLRSSFCFSWFLFYLCAGEDLPLFSSDANKGCQWEIQTDEGWVPYWDS